MTTPDHRAFSQDWEPSILTLHEVLERQRSRPSFRVPGLIHGTLTGLVGEPAAGKSALAVCLIASGLASGGTFLGRSWAERPDRVVLCTTDAGGLAEYANRLNELGVSDMATADRLHLVEDPPTATAGWAAIRQRTGLTSRSLVIIDNLTGFMPDINSTKDAHAFFGAIRAALIQHGVGVVVVAHKSEKFGERGKARTPMGTTAISAYLRHAVFVDRATEGVRLTTWGNECPAPEVLHLVRKGSSAAAYEVVAEELASATAARRRAETMDERAAIADWVVGHCQGKNKTATAKEIANHFGGTEGTYLKRLQPQQPIGHLLDFSHEDLSWRRRTS